MKYTNTHLEDYIQKLYHSIDIYHPRQLDIETVSARLGISVDYYPTPSVTFGSNIILDSRLSYELQWQQFGHEVCHALWHSGNQLHAPLSFRQYQEWKAKNFAYQLCMPTFMLQKLKLSSDHRENVFKIHKKFNVDIPFAIRRYNQFIDRTSNINN